MTSRRESNFVHIRSVLGRIDMPARRISFWYKMIRPLRRAKIVENPASSRVTLDTVKHFRAKLGPVSIVDVYSTDDTLIAKIRAICEHQDFTFSPLIERTYRGPSGICVANVTTVLHSQLARVFGVTY